MTIFFSASYRSKPEFAEDHQIILDALKVADERVIIDPLYDGAKVKTEAKAPTSVLASLKKADALIAHISYPSTKVGYLVHEMVQLNKPVVLFYSGDWDMQFFSQLEKENEKFQLVRYASSTELKEEVGFALEFIRSAQDVRFNFFVSSKISTYLDWVSKHRKVPRSVFLRRLIEEDMKKEDASAR